MHGDRSTVLKPPARYRERLAEFGGPVAENRELITDDDAVVLRPVENVIVEAPWYRGRIVSSATPPTAPRRIAAMAPI